MRARLFPFWLVIVLCVLTGCGGQKKQDGKVDKAEVQKMIRMELMAPEFKKTVQDALAKEDIRAMIAQTIESPDGQKVVGKTVKKQMDTEEIRTKVNDSMIKALEDPKVKKAIDEAVTKAAQQMLMKAASSGGGSSGGGKSGGGGSK